MEANLDSRRSGVSLARCEVLVEANLDSHWSLKNMLRLVRAAAGLGSPPCPYYTNSVESLNKVVKLHTGYQKNQLPKFVEMMEELYNTQESEIMKALSGNGEYRVISNFKHHQYEPRKWFAMSEKQRKIALKRFM